MANRGKDWLAQAAHDYNLTRYPNGFDIGAPQDYYTDGEAQQAIEDAERIYNFCQQSFY